MIFLHLVFHLKYDVFDSPFHRGQVFFVPFLSVLSDLFFTLREFFNDRLIGLLDVIGAFSVFCHIGVKIAQNLVKLLLSSYRTLLVL